MMVWNGLFKKKYKYTEDIPTFLKKKKKKKKKKNREILILLKKKKKKKPWNF